MISCIFPPRFHRLSALALILACVGCGTGSTTVLVPALGGSEKVRVELTRSGPDRAKADGFEVTVAGFIPQPAPQASDLAFAFTVKDGRPPRRVTVEDITEDTARPILTDETPALTGNKEWRHVISAINATDPRIEWVHRMNNEIRIYRFTIVAADGHRVVLNQAANYPSFLKTLIRDSLTPKT